MFRPTNFVKASMLAVLLSLIIPTVLSIDPTRKHQITASKVPIVTVQSDYGDDGWAAIADRWALRQHGEGRFRWFSLRKPAAIPDWRMYGWQDIEQYTAADPANEILIEGWTGRLMCARTFGREVESRNETTGDILSMTIAAEAFIQLGLGRLFARTSQQQYDLMCGERIAAFASPNSATVDALAVVLCQPLDLPKAIGYPS